MTSRTAQNIAEIEVVTVTAPHQILDTERDGSENSIGEFPDYLTYIASSIRNSEKVIHHSILKSDRWTKSCYDLLSKIIAEDLNSRLSPKIRMQMGVSLSAKTLQKIVSGTYVITYPIDPRTLNTLNKIVCFLGHQNWNNFISFYDANLKKEAVIEDPEVILKQVVEEAVKREHYAYCQLPKIAEAHIAKSFIRNSPSYNLIMDALVDKSKNKQIISNNYNPSSCEILDIEVKRIEHNYAQVHAKVYWLLCWWDAVEQRYVKRYKDISDHFYILNKDSLGKWMIKTNASMSDLMEIV